MRILALETATPSCSVALWLDGELQSLQDDTPHSHTQKILSMVDQLLHTHSLEVSDLDAIAFDCGPGSFTGLRIGAGVAQGLSLAQHIPTLAIHSLDAMAHQANAPAMAVALDARMEEVYYRSYQHGNACNEIAVGNINTIALDPAIDWTLVGNGWQAYETPQAYQHYNRQAHTMPHAKDIAALASQQFEQHLPAAQAQPVYIRNV